MIPRPCSEDAKGRKNLVDWRVHSMMLAHWFTLNQRYIYNVHVSANQKKNMTVFLQTRSPICVYVCAAGKLINNYLISLVLACCLFVMWCCVHVGREGPSLFALIREFKKLLRRRRRQRRLKNEFIFHLRISEYS